MTAIKPHRFFQVGIVVLMIATLGLATFTLAPAAKAICARTTVVEYRPAIYECETSAPGWGTIVNDYEDKIWFRSVSNLPYNQVRVYLTVNEHISWWKGLEVKNQYNYVAGSVQTQDANRGPNATTVYTYNLNLGQSSLHFLKAKFLGFHTDMYYLQNLSAYAGRTIYIYWGKDGPCPSYNDGTWDC